MQEATRTTTANVDREIVELVPALRLFARRFERNPTDADDLVQETLTRALNSLDHFQAGTSLKSWLFTIMRNTFCTSYNKRIRETVGIKEDVSLYAGASAPSQEWTRRAGEVRVALDRLNPLYRDALILVLLGATYEEAAELSGCKIGTIKSRVSRARFELLTVLGETDCSQGPRLQ